MDLGIAGRKAIVCASSKGLGRACAASLAEAGCEVVINGRNRDVLEATAAELRKATGAKITAVAADVATAEGQSALLAACPQPDILVNNNAGPPFRDFRELSRQAIIDGVIANMAVAIELTQKVIDPMIARKFGRIVNITSGTVKAPLVGLDLSSGARRPHRLHGGRRALGRGRQRDHQLPAAWRLRHRPVQFEHREHREEARHFVRAGEDRARRDHSGKARRPAGGIRRDLRVPMLDPCRLHHRAEPLDRRRHLPGRVLKNDKPVTRAAFRCKHARDT
jgi:hypothetical protein